MAEGRVERLPDLAAELVQLPVDLIVTAGNAGVLAAKHATSTLPIVVVSMGMDDPVDQRIVESLAHPPSHLRPRDAERRQRAHDRRSRSTS